MDTVFVATVDTRYQIMAVAETYQGARRLALQRALEELQSTGGPFWSEKNTPADVENYFGVNVNEVLMNSAVVVS